jgi:hypothetical protein
VHSLSFFPEEKELLLLAPQLLYHSRLDGSSSTTVIASPAYQRDEYWVDHALRYCYLHYFNKEYSHRSDTRTIGGEVVHRPNHGLVHAYRVMLFVAPVIDYFASYAEEEMLRQFCVEMTAINKQYLKTAAIFRTTGRESEVGERDNPEWYHEYKTNSNRNLFKYVRRHPNCFEKDTAMIVTGEELGEFHHNPFNQIILNMAHNLDLLRCFGRDLYLELVECMPVTRSSDQSIALKALIRYAIQLATIHGDCVQVQFNSHNELEAVDEDYEAGFGALSNNPSQLQRKSDLVPVPDFMKSNELKKLGATGLLLHKHSHNHHHHKRNHGTTGHHLFC